MVKEGTIRLLRAADVPVCFEISGAANWNQTEQDWANLVDLNPETCFGVECEGCLAATATLSCYGDRLAWVGMVLTRAEFQRRGFAGRLLRRVLEEADARRVRTVKLDATAQGQPLYETLGFIPEQVVERWLGPGGGAAELAVPGAPDLNLDIDAFGADRGPLLLRLGTALTTADGFIMHRAGRELRYIGPCVAKSTEAAEQLIRSVLRRSPGPWLWDIPAENTEARSLASSLGFTVSRRLVRMYRGEPVRAAESLVYGLAGFEFG